MAGCTGRIERFVMAHTSATPAIGRQLLDRLQAADGQLSVPNPASAVRAKLRRTIWQLRDQQLVPDGLQLTYTGRDHGDMTIHLRPRAEAISPARPASPSVHVPARLTRPHPLVAATRDALKRARRDEYGRLAVHARGVIDVRVFRAQTGRALRLLQALVRAAEQHGFEPAKRQQGHGPVQLRHGQHAYNLRLVEQLDRTPHEPTRAELDEQRRWSWTRVPKHDYHPSGRLRIELDRHYGQSRRYRWSDTSRWQLDDKLGEILQELQARVDLDEQRQLEREREAECRRQEHERRLARGRRQMATEIRASALRAQVSAWQHAAAIHAYCDALEHRLDHTDEPADDTREWIAWTRQHADTTDPTRTGPLPQTPYVPDLPDYEVERWLRDQRTRR